MGPAALEGAPAVRVLMFLFVAVRAFHAWLCGCVALLSCVISLSHSSTISLPYAPCSLPRTFRLLDGWRLLQLLFSVLLLLPVLSALLPGGYLLSPLRQVRAYICI